MHQVQRLASYAVSRTLGGRNLTKTLNEIWHTHSGLNPAQRGAIQDLSYGVFRNLGFLKTILGMLVKKQPKDSQIEALLLVALYQLNYSQAAKHAVVDHAVGVAPKFGKPLVNAVLRNFLRQKDALLEAASNSEAAIFNHPKWWIDKLKNQYPADYARILDAGNSRPPMTLRINRRKTTSEAYQALLQENGIEFIPLSESALMLSKPMPVDSLPGFAEGLASVQDLGAQKAAILLDLEDGMRVLDACAAPGGKSAHILEAASVDLLSLDNSPSRAEQIRENFGRLGLAGKVLTADASDTSSWWDGTLFQRILADVPCSASGVVRRHPDIKWLRRPEDIETFTTQQSAILDALWQTLESGGKLLYSTCSVFEEENMGLVALFLKRHADAILLADEGFQLLPDDKQDGFFYALIKKA